MIPRLASVHNSDVCINNKTSSSYHGSENSMLHTARHVTYVSDTHLTWFDPRTSHSVDCIYVHCKLDNLCRCEQEAPLLCWMRAEAEGTLWRTLEWSGKDTLEPSDLVVLSLFTVVHCIQHPYIFCEWERIGVWSNVSCSIASKTEWTTKESVFIQHACQCITHFQYIEISPNPAD